MGPEPNHVKVSIINANEERAYINPITQDAFFFWLGLALV